MSATCPFCDYEGSPRSVESHISGKVDEDHKGEVGRNHREDLLAQSDEEDTAEDQAPLLPASGTSSTDEDHPPEGGPQGLPLPELSPAEMVVLGVLVFAVIVVLIRLNDSSSENEDDQEDVDEQHQEENKNTFDPVLPEQEAA